MMFFKTPPSCLRPFVDNNYVFEVGGKNKGHEQIVGLENALLALDNLEYVYSNKIPFWLFGMLY